MRIKATNATVCAKPDDTFDLQDCVDMIGTESTSRAIER
jgi:hypothetical protein